MENSERSMNRAGWAAIRRSLAQIFRGNSVDQIANRANKRLQACVGFKLRFAKMLNLPVCHFGVSDETGDNFAELLQLAFDAIEAG